VNTAGILAFEDSAQGRKMASTSFGGLRLLERGIRTMARAGVRRLLVITPAESNTAIGAVTRKLDLELEFVAWGQQADMHFSSGEDVLCLLGDHAHHHTSLKPFVADGTGADDVVVQITPPSQQLALLVPTINAQTLQFDDVQGAAVEKVDGDVSTGAFLVDGGLSPHEVVLP